MSINAIMREDIIKVENVSFSYRNHHELAGGSFPDNNSVKALHNISLKIFKGEYAAVIGRNGSGKSTLARLLNAILLPSAGVVYINGFNTADEQYMWEIRRNVGMVFQNPDNQIVATIVEDDIAFGPENLGIQPAEIQERVNEALRRAGMTEYSKHAPHMLSGGQKQRISIAGILAMKPECIVLDEATAMLDPAGRKEVMEIVEKLHREEGITVIHITHHMDEAIQAERVIVIDGGMVVLDGKPREVFSKVEKLREIGLDVPQVAELMYELNKEGLNLPSGIITIEDAVKYISRLVI